MEDDIANVALKQTSDILVPYLGPIYQATFSLQIYLEEWKKYGPVVVRKLGKPDYAKVKAHRPVVLLKTIAKPLSMAGAEDLSYILEKHQLLPSSHFRGRPGRSSTNAIHILVKFVHDSWRAGKV